MTDVEGTRSYAKQLLRLRCVSKPLVGVRTIVSRLTRHYRCIPVAQTNPARSRIPARTCSQSIRQSSKRTASYDGPYRAVNSSKLSSWCGSFASDATARLALNARVAANCWVGSRAVVCLMARNGVVIVLDGDRMEVVARRAAMRRNVVADMMSSAVSIRRTAAHDQDQFESSQRGWYRKAEPQWLSFRPARLG